MMLRRDLAFLLLAVVVGVQGRKCPSLGCIGHGTVSPTEGPFLKDSVVTYRCFQGYVLKGNEERKCMGNGQWSGTVPRCEEEQGIVCGSGKCHRYAECHDKKCKCKSNFQGDGGNCQVKGCPRPGCFGNGEHSGNQEYFTKDNIITYRCHRGYHLVGQAERRCMGDGQWSGREPSCQRGKPKPQRQQGKKKKACSRLQDPANGSIRYSDGTYKVGTVATYECRHPYRLKGNGQRTCQANTKWSGTAGKCTRPIVKCPAPPPIEYGSVVGSKKRYGARTRVSYKCKEGYVIAGNAERTCQQSGHWTGSVPRCEMPDPCRKKYGHRCHKQARCEKPQGEKDPRCICNDGYQGDGVNCNRRQKDECEKRNNQRCHKFADCIRTDGGKYQCKCRVGYTGDGVSCQQKICGKPPGIAHGKLNTNQDKFTPGNVISYQCNQGYGLSGVGQRTCKEDGSWSGTDPQCQENN